MEARQRVEPSGTNSPIALRSRRSIRLSRPGRKTPCNVRSLSPTFSDSGRQIAAGKHPVPFRTRQLSPPAPMVLGQKPRESRSPPGFFHFFSSYLSLLKSLDPSLKESPEDPLDHRSLLGLPSERSPPLPAKENSPRQLSPPWAIPHTPPPNALRKHRFAFSPHEERLKGKPPLVCGNPGPHKLKLPFPQPSPRFRSPQ